MKVTCECKHSFEVVEGAQRAKCPRCGRQCEVKPSRDWLLDLGEEAIALADGAPPSKPPQHGATGEQLAECGVLKPEQLEQLRAGLDTVAPQEKAGKIPIAAAAAAPSQAHEFLQIPGYEVMELLGQGGMGVVYRAYDRSLARTVAIKLLPEGLALRPGLVERFRREARAMAALVHPNIVIVYAVGAAGRRQFIVMEYVQGYSLDRMLARKAYLEPPQAVKIVLQVADALSYAHKNGVIHRDLKPSNILIEQNLDRVKVVDFGLAKILGDICSDLTRESAVMGTASYMSPEQARGEEVDHRADIHALGVIMYELLCGQLPYKGDTPTTTVRLIADCPPTPFPAQTQPVPQALLDVMAKAMQKERAERFSDMGEFVRALYRAQSQSQAPAAAHKERPKAKQLVALPVGKMLAAIVAAAVLAAAYFFGYVPLNARIKIHMAYSQVLAGKVGAGINELKELARTLPEKYQAKVAQLIVQASLEDAKNLAMAREVSSYTVQMRISDVKETKRGLILGVSIVNTGSEALALKSEFFYLRGASDIVLAAAGHKANTLDGVTVPPGQETGGFVAFRRYPFAPARIERGKYTYTTYSLIFNDGKDYVKIEIP